MRPKSEVINENLRQHAVELHDWDYQEQIRILHDWAERFNEAFKLGLKTPAIRIDRIAVRKLGTYHPGRNGFGLGHEITLNARHLDRPLAEQLRTLLHELLHEWQCLFGKPGRRNYHNRQFRFKARLYGLIVDSQGHDVGVEAGRFTILLAENGVDLTSLRDPEEDGERAAAHTLPRGDSSLKKWSCGCTNVRCAVELAARCERCGNLFQEAAPSW